MPAPRAVMMRPDFFVAQHLVFARLLDVEDLAAQRQDRLETAVAPLLGRATGRVALHQVQLAVLGGSFSEQSASLPGRVMPSMALLRMTGRAPSAPPGGPAPPSGIFSTIFRASLGFSSKYCADSSREGYLDRCTSPLPSLALVWPSNCGSGSSTLTMAVRPSRTSSPVRVALIVLEQVVVLARSVERAGEGRSGNR